MKNLSAEEQVLAQRILGGDTSVPYNGCLNQDFLDEEATWVADNVLKGVSRCARCELPKAWGGRTVHNLSDVMRPLMNKEKLAARRGCSSGKRACVHRTFPTPVVQTRRREK